MSRNAHALSPPGGAFPPSENPQGNPCYLNQPNVDETKLGMSAAKDLYFTYSQ